MAGHRVALYCGRSSIKQWTNVFDDPEFAVKALAMPIDKQLQHEFGQRPGLFNRFLQAFGPEFSNKCVRIMICRQENHPAADLLRQKKRNRPLRSLDSRCIAIEKQDHIIGQRFEQVTHRAAAPPGPGELSVRAVEHQRGPGEPQRRQPPSVPTSPPGPSSACQAPSIIRPMRALRSLGSGGRVRGQEGHVLVQHLLVHHHHTGAVVVTGDAEQAGALGRLPFALRKLAPSFHLRVLGDLYDTFALFEIFGQHQVGFAAVNDPDFERIREEPSFIDIIEPTPSGA